MDPQRWQQLKSVLSEAFEEESTDARWAFVARSCSGDQALLQEAESLLAEAEILRRCASDDLEACAEDAARRIRREDNSQIGKRIGAYVVTGKIGRGGMGTVYLAARADGYFEKDVAIKLLNPGIDTEDMVRRFHSERQVLARLDHPNIARLLDAGTGDDGAQYFVMEYVEGVPVTRYLEENNASISSRLELFLKICSAVEAAHASSVVHRDLKASNILVNAKGEVKLLDFGIAKMMLGAGGATEPNRPGGELLTPLSASPEQARGEAVTESTDIYGLGVLLYEILSGEKAHRFPHPNPTLQELLTVLCDQDPLPPSSVVKDPQEAQLLRGDLDAIVLCALQKDPAKRYRSARALADDVRRHLAGKTTDARSRTPMRLTLVSLGLVLGLGLLLLGARFVLTRSSPEFSRAAASRKIAILPFRSVAPGSAVLPFESLGSNAKDAYLVDAIHEDVLGQLARISDLKVISRDSVAAYRGAINGRAIAEFLDVGCFVEGSVQKIEDHLRVNLRLIDARDEKTVWQGQFEKPLDEIFSLERELIQAIAAQLNCRLSPEDQSALGELRTSSRAAYDLYARARFAFNQRDYSRAIDLLQACVARDPKFVLAHCLLSKAYVNSFRFVLPTKENLSAARDAAEMAIRLSPGSADARLALARYYRASRDFERARQELSGIGIPQDRAEFDELLALAERRRGHWKDALQDGEAAFELDPHNPFIAIELLESYIALRQFKKAEDFADRATKRFPAEDDVMSVYRSYCRLGEGKLSEARSVLENSPARTVWGTNRLIELAIFARDLDRAAALVATLPAEKKYSMPWEGTIAKMRGQPDKAKEFFDGAADYHRKKLSDQPDDLDALTGLSIACANLGQKEEAVRTARHAVELAPLSRNAIDGPVQMLGLAGVYVQVGETEAALEQLAAIAEVPAGPDYGRLKFDPVWDGIRADPRFREVMARAAKPPRSN